MTSRIIPASVPDSFRAVASKIQVILDDCANGIPAERTTYFVRGYILGLLLGDAIGLRDSDQLKEMLPAISEQIREGIPYGHAGVSPPEDRAIKPMDTASDVSFDMAMGIGNDRYFYERNGERFPNRSIWAWIGYLYGELVCSSITRKQYEDLRALLPSIDDDPTITLGPYLALDELLIRRAQRVKRA